MRNYLDWPALPAEERCCVKFDRGASLERGLAGRTELETDAWQWKDDAVTDCQPKRR